MKRLLFIILLTIIFSAVFFSKDFLLEAYSDLVTFSYCDKPITYGIGSIDPKFGIGENELKSHVDTATQRWNTSVGRVLFKYDPASVLKVNMVYDERQSLIGQIDTMTKTLEAGRSGLDVQLEEYLAQQSTFNKRVAELNEKVIYWNSRGGAAEDIYRQLINEQENLDLEYQALSKYADQLQSRSSTLNNDIGSLNQTVNLYNNLLQKKPEAALYIPSTSEINIYSYLSKTQLEDVLTHEFGHALGLDHSENATSIMYPIANNDIHLTGTDIEQAKYYCRDQNIMENGINTVLDILRDLNLIERLGLSLQ